MKYKVILTKKDCKTETKEVFGKTAGNAIRAARRLFNRANYSMYLFSKDANGQYNEVEKVSDVFTSYIYDLK